MADGSNRAPDMRATRVCIVKRVKGASQMRIPTAEKKTIEVYAEQVE